MLASGPNPQRARHGREIKMRTQRRVVKEDKFASHAILLAVAESSPESVERLLAVTRLLLTFCTDVLRPSTAFQDTPLSILGQHYLSHRDAGVDHLLGTTTKCFLQELCAYDASTVITHPRKTQQGDLLGTFKLECSPSALAKSSLLAKAAHVQIDLQGQGSVHFPAHNEEYTFSLPQFALSEALADKCEISITGQLLVQCSATGMSTSLNFKADTMVKGSLSRLLGEGSIEVATISGSWMQQLLVHHADWHAEGVLFDASTLAPPVITQVNLQQLGPMRMPCLWSALHNAVLCCQGSKAGKKAEVLARSFSNHLHSLSLTPAHFRAAAKASAADLQQPATSIADTFDPLTEDMQNVLPCIRAEHTEGRRLLYKLQYVLRRIASSADRSGP